MKGSMLVLVLGTTCLGRLAWAEPALPAVLDGDPALVASVGGDLAQRGIATTAPPDSEVVRVRLAQEPQGIVVDLHDPQGREEERTVASAQTAAALIESWTRQEIADPLLAPRRAPEVVPPPAPTIVQTPAPPPVAPPSRWRPTVHLEATTADAGGWWLGARAGTCARLGPVCLGGEARLARRFGRDPADESGPLGPMPSYDRSDWQALATAEVPISLGTPVLLLGMGAGFGRWLDGGRATVGPRSEARAHLLVPFATRLALEVGLTAALARHDDGEGWPSRRTDGQIALGLGLRWGLP